MYTFLYDQDAHTYFDPIDGIDIKSAADFDKFWFDFYSAIQKSKESPLDSLVMEIEDYEAMRFDRIFGDWKDEPFLGKPANAESIKTLRSLRRFAVKKSENGKEIFELLQENDPEDLGFFEDEIEDEVYVGFATDCKRIIKLIGKVKFGSSYLKNEADIIDWYDTLLPEYELQWHFFEAELMLIDHYLGNKRPKDKKPITADDLHYFDVHWMLHWLEYFRDHHDLDEYCRFQMLEGADIPPNWYKKVEKFRFTDEAISLMGEPRHLYPEKEMLDDIEWWAKIHEGDLQKRLSKYKKSEIPEPLKAEQKLYKKYRTQQAIMDVYYSK